MFEKSLGQIALCKFLECTNAVAKRGRICDPCYLKMPGGRKTCLAANRLFILDKVSARSTCLMLKVA